MNDEVTGRKYPVRMILRVIDYGSATYYGSKGEDAHKKRGPVTPLSDKELKIVIKNTMRSIPFHGTGYKKIHARMQRELLGKGHSVGKNRVFRLMREDDLLNKAPGGRGSSRVHDGKLQQKRRMTWGIDGVGFLTWQIISIRSSSVIML